MTPLTYEQFMSLRENAELLEADHHGEKVLNLTDGSFLKLFRRKRLLSSSLYRPYAVRFARNADALKARYIPCPEIIDTYRINSIERTAVHYWPLPGETLRQCLPQQDSGTLSRTCRRLGAFIAQLHRQGVYFRSLHLGNIVLTDDSELGLIDIADMRCGARALNRNQRKRNFQHLFRYTRDIAMLQPEAIQFAAGYCSDLPPAQKAYFNEYLARLLQASPTIAEGIAEQCESEQR
ncbi:phosphotransferase [Zestomonas carbonaria]|uniref:Lipopolysaccharide kinase (Kdo/WaaP) family protein n=1 Tax=Zestomonas carbonaria TaxID=2762745 RepID=A0A7U7I8U9_9GAMM|nr:phosphotransferase [Pseudomonas carbonaria]CAD5107046.1 hypothetical protein PSEWESI4_01317 [Pseudomonas carbonaria]